MVHYETLKEAKAIDSHLVAVTFENGQRGVFDCAPYMRDNYWALLRNPAFFRQVRADCGMLCWPNDIDIAPEDVWEDAQRVQM